MKTSFVRRTTIAVALASTLSLSLIPQLITRSSSAHVAVEPNAPVSSESTKQTVVENYGKLPLSFEPNRGQAKKQVKFISRGDGYLMLLNATSATLSLGSGERSEQLRMSLIGSDPNANLTPEVQQEGKSNYLIGSDKRKWQTDIPNYSKVRVSNAYPGIDAIYYGSDQQRLEFDFVVKPDRDVETIRLSFEGAKKITIDGNGGLRVKLDHSEVTQPKPIIYQEVNGERRNVQGGFVLVNETEVRFEVGDYDRTRELVIDPKIIYASLHGGNGDDRAKGVAVNKNGEAFFVGSTTSTNLNVTGGVQGVNRGSTDGFVVKVNKTGTQRIFSTYLGSSSSDIANSVAVTSDGKACITGTADADADVEFPTTSNRYQGPSGLFGNHSLNVFVTVLNGAGNGLEYSTFLGKRDVDIGFGIAVDAANKLYVTGDTLDPSGFPVKNAFQRRNGTIAAFVCKIDPTQSGDDSLVYSSLLGGDDNRTDAKSVAVTPNGVAFIIGTTLANDFPTKSASSLSPLQTVYKGATDGFVAKISPTGSLIYSTYFGGDGLDDPKGIAVDSNERAYISGVTTSSAASFLLQNAFDSTRNGGSDGFVAKLNADGTALFYSSLFGGNANDEVTAVAIDGGGNLYGTGFSNNTDGLTVVNGFPPEVPDGGGGLTFLKIGPSDATGSNVPSILVFDTAGVGNGQGIALDRKGNVYIAGTTSVQMPAAMANGFQQTFGGINDSVILKIQSTVSDTIGVFRPSTRQFLLRNTNTAGPADLTRIFGQTTDLPIAGDWDGDGVQDVGTFRPSTGQFLLRMPTILTFFTTVTINLGQSGDLPVAGDWNGDGIDTPGVFRPSTGEWFATDAPNNDSTPVVNVNFFFGQAGDLPVAGDFDGDGRDAVGVFRPSTGQFFLNNQKQNFAADVIFNFGAVGDLPLAGDWLGDGSDGVGVFRPSTGQFFLNNNNVSNVADLIFVFGQNGDSPVSGTWDNTP